MIDEKELKDSVKECVDIAMEQNDEAKREIFAGLFEEVDRLINETITIQAINDDEKKKWFDNEMIKTYEQEIKELQERIDTAKKYIVNTSTWKRSREEYGLKGGEKVQELSSSKILQILDGSDK